MNVIISKRLELLEKRFIVNTTPSLIMINYDAGKGVYIIKETHCKTDKALNIVKGGYDKWKEITALEDYVIFPEFNGQIIIDLSAKNEDESIITAVNLPDFRKQVKIGKRPFAFVDIRFTEKKKELEAEIVTFRQ